MDHYSDTVASIVEDYLERLKAKLGSVPSHEQDDFLQEIRSHIFESFLNADGPSSDDDVARILGVLRKIGEPAEVVADRFSETMMRSGARQKLPLHIVAGVVIALFGIPLGFGGGAVLAGVLVALAGVLVWFYAVTASVFLVSTVLLVSGLTRIYEPAVWDRLIAIGVIQLDSQVAGILDPISPAGQGTLLIILAGVFAACGLGMIWVGKHLTRGIRFLFTLLLTWIQQLAVRIRHAVFSERGAIFRFNKDPLNQRS